MLLVKRDEISPREFIVRRHKKFQLERRIEKAVKEPYEGKGLSSDEFYWLVLKVSSLNGLSVLLTRREKGKDHAVCVLVIGCLTRVINGKVVEDEAIYSPQRFLVEVFFLLVLKPPGSYFNNELLPSCRSSKFSSSFPATSVRLCTPLVSVRPNRYSDWRQSVLIFLRQTLH